MYVLIPHIQKFKVSPNGNKKVMQLSFTMSLHTLSTPQSVY